MVSADYITSEIILSLFNLQKYIFHKQNDLIEKYSQFPRCSFVFNERFDPFSNDFISQIS